MGPTSLASVSFGQPAGGDEEGGDEAPGDEGAYVGHDHIGQEASKILYLDFGIR